MANVDLTAQRLRELLHYDPSTGVFTRRAWRGGTSRAGSVAGGNPSNKSGYAQISVDGRLYYAHRLAWLYVHGEHPTSEIDHIDGNRLNNRLANLRDVTRTVNMQNQRRAKSHNQSGVLGVSKRKVGNQFYYFAEIKAEGVPRYVGCFKTAKEAGQAYLDAKRRLHEGCAV